jgi:7-cyano-7-deazaguanine synthase
MAAGKAVVLCSGGLNSAVVTAIARREHQAALLHVRYAHRAQARETELFEKLVTHFEVRDKLIVDMPHIAAIGGNARVVRKMQIEDALAMGATESNCHVRGLIGSLLSAAFAWAHVIGASKVFIGVSENLGAPGPTTSAIYPDYSQEFIHIYNHLYAAASPNREISIAAPLINLSRCEIVKLGRRMDTPFESTWSCISSGTQACGACVGCATRNRGFLDAAEPDPIMLTAPQPMLV